MAHKTYYNQTEAYIQGRREAGRTVDCPCCGQPAGTPCITKRGRPRKANHTERYAVLDGRSMDHPHITSRRLGPPT
jgi:hypothetical protein